MKKRVKKVLIIEPRRAFSSLEAFVFYMSMRSLRVCAKITSRFRASPKIHLSPFKHK